MVNQSFGTCITNGKKGRKKRQHTSSVSTITVAASLMYIRIVLYIHTSCVCALNLFPHESFSFLCLVCSFTG